MIRTRTFRNATLASAAFALVSAPAFAHHPLAGQPMETFAHGLLSGIGHPLLGFDHLFFVLAMGVAALFTGMPKSAPLAYIAAMMAGVGIAAAGIALPIVEPVIVLSLLVVGGVLLSGKALKFQTAVLLFAGAGLFHGAAFGGAIAAQESASAQVLVGYLLGLAALQWAMAVGAGMAAQKIWGAAEASNIQSRLAGAAVAGVGAFLALETIEGVVFSALGIG